MRVAILINLFFIVSIFFSVSPFVAIAQAPLVPCGTETTPDGKVANPCGWDGILELVSNVANYLILLGAALSAIAFAWAGFLMMTAAGEMSKIEHAKSIFTKVLIGFLIMLSAWLIVHALNAGLIDNEFSEKSTVKPI